MNIYNHFINQNVAPKEARQITVFNEKGIRVGVIPLSGLTFPDTGNKLYTAGLLSDVHIAYDTGTEDLQRSFSYFKNTGVDFICICGDLGKNGTEDELQQYKEIVENYSSGIPIYIAAGNHEFYSATSNTYLSSYTGHPLYYSFEQGNDVYIMCGVGSGTKGEIFVEGELQWLYETLEKYRNKRCFLFEHVLTPGGCGDILGLYPYAKLTDTEGTVFKSLLKHYKNTIFFHGHSHMMFNLQEYGMTANYDHIFGIHSVHIPSNAIPRTIGEDGSMAIYYAGSEGYVMDVYENGIHLRGRDFVKGEFLPIASYWLDTTLKTIEAGTYTDSTGIITT